MDNNTPQVQTHAATSIGILTLLCLIFMVLKLCNVIGWSWWLVFSPAWIPFALVTLGALVFLIFVLGVEVVVRWRKRQNKKKLIREEAI